MILEELLEKRDSKKSIASKEKLGTMLTEEMKTKEGQGKHTRKIGSVHTNRLNYPKNQKFFHSSDIPATIREVKNKIKNDIKSDILGLQKKPWNTSHDATNKQNDVDQNLFQVRVGLKDEKIQKLKDKKVKEGCDCRNVVYHGWDKNTKSKVQGWDVSVEINKRERIRQFHEGTANSLEKTKKKQEILLKNYKTPFEKTKTEMEKTRLLKEEEKEVREKLRKECKYANPRASDEKTDAEVFKMLTQKKIDDNRLNMKVAEKEITGKPNLSQTLKKEKKHEYHHDGVYGAQQWTNVIPKEDIIDDKPIESPPPTQKIKTPVHMWSCCQNELKESKGCVRVTKDPKKWNMVSY